MVENNLFLYKIVYKVKKIVSFIIANAACLVARRIGAEPLLYWLECSEKYMSVALPKGRTEVRVLLDGGVFRGFSSERCKRDTQNRVNLRVDFKASGYVFLKQFG